MIRNVCEREHTPHKSRGISMNPWVHLFWFVYLEDGLDVGGIQIWLPNRKKQPNVWWFLCKVHHISIVFRFGTSPPKKIGGLKFGPKIRSCFFCSDGSDRSPHLSLSQLSQLVGQDSGGSKEMANCQFPGATFRPNVAPDLGKLRESCPPKRETPGIVSKYYIYIYMDHPKDQPRIAWSAWTFRDF